MASQDVQPILCARTGRGLLDRIHREIDNSPEPGVIHIEGVSPAIFKKAYRIKRSHRPEYLFDYDEESKVLIVQVLSPIPYHLGRILDARLKKLNGLSLLSHVPGQRGISSRGYKGLKQATQIGIPIPFQKHRLPLVIESGRSHELAYLRRSMQRWFDLFRNEIGIVLLFYADIPAGMIYIERWEPSKPEEQHGLDSLGLASAGPQPPSGSVSVFPELKQAICISRELVDGQYQYTATGGDLVLGFAALNLREPKTEDDKDYVITSAELQDSVKEFWDMMHFMHLDPWR